MKQYISNIGSLELWYVAFDNNGSQSPAITGTLKLTTACMQEQLSNPWVKNQNGLVGSVTALTFYRDSQFKLSFSHWNLSSLIDSDLQLLTQIRLDQINLTYWVLWLIGISNCFWLQTVFSSNPPVIIETYDL